VPAIDYLAEHMPEFTRVVVYMKGRGQVYSLPMASVLAWRAQRKYLRKPERGCQRLSPPLREWQLTRVSEPFLLPHVSLAQEQWIVVRPAEVATV
jgi:hypothetical protein